MYISLYRKYRPQTFSDMVGQSAAVKVLKESLREGRLGHAYLFSGPRGCGKTSAARLVAKTLNCEALSDDHEPCGKCSSCFATALGDHLDVIEIDGASNRGVGEIRDLKSHVNLKPLASKNKIYIIDEVHMLTEQAFNALLKTLEEPPANVYFLLATTEPHKVPVTIRSRCQHIPFHRISMADMMARLRYICGEEKIDTDDEAIWEIARSADGALRDALSFMEQAIALGDGKLTIESVGALMGGSNRAELEKWIRDLRESPEEAAKDLSEMLSRGVSPERFTELIFALLRDLWIYTVWHDKGLEAIDASQTELKFLKEESAHWDREKLSSLCLFCGNLLPKTRYGMRLEVFSGLIMVGFLDILEGKKSVSAVPERRASTKRETPAREPERRRRTNAKSAPTASSDRPIFDDDGFDDLVPPRPKAKATHRKKLEKEPPIQDLKSLGGKLGEIADALGPHGLTFAAALLNTKIVKAGDTWAFDFGDLDSPAFSFLNVPRNKKTLADALQKAWNIAPPDSGEETAESPEPKKEPKDQKPAVEQKPASPKARPEKSRKDDSETEASTDRDRILKLMGAELLYVENSEPEGQTDDEWK